MTKKIKPINEFSNQGAGYFTVEYFFKGDGKALDVLGWNFYGDKVDYVALERGIAFKKKKHAHRAANFILNFLRESEPFPGCITSLPDEGAQVWVISLLNAASCISIDFSQSNSGHRNFLKNHALFSSEKDARAASKSILAALKAKVLRQNLNCLTEAPVDGTMVYALSFYGVGGVLILQFKSNNPHHMQLLELGLLYKSREDAKRALEYFKEQFKPTTPKAVPVPAEPDAQPDMPF